MLKGLTSTFALLTTTAFVLGSVMESYSGFVDDAFHTKSSKIVTEKGETYDKFKPDSKYLNADLTGNSKALIEDAITLGAKIGAEGTVLLKNTNGKDGKPVLPLATGSKVTLLGTRSKTTLLGAGMGVKAIGSMITLEDALSKTETQFNDKGHIATYVNRGRGGSGPTLSGDVTTMDNYPIDGAGYKVNPKTLAAYKTYNDSLGSLALTNNDSVSNPDPKAKNYLPFDPQEPSMSDLKAIDSTFDDYTGYQDAAIVVIGRPSSETYDFWKGGVKDGLGMKEPLQLSTNEKAIIEEATDKFDKVIVLLNSASPMDVSELQNNEKIQSIAYIGQPGIYGLLGVAQVLSGKVTPSGKLPDTWASNQLSTPAMVNFGDYTFRNASDITRSTVIGGANTSHKYVVEA